MTRYLLILIAFCVYLMTGCGGGSSHSDNGPFVITSDNIQSVVIKIVDGLPQKIADPSDHGLGGDYEIINAEVSGDNDSGYNITANLRYHASVNIEFAISDLILCEDGKPLTGDLVVSDGETEAAVVFDSCLDYTITYDDATNMYEW